MKERIIESKNNYQKACENTKSYQDILVHDINNVLNNILMSAELCLIYVNKAENQNQIKEYMYIIKDQIKKGVHLVSNIRKLSELEVPEI